MPSSVPIHRHTTAGSLLVVVTVLLFVLQSAAADTSTADPPLVIRVLTYNVHGLFRLAAKDDPGARTPAIGWLSRPYDLILYQEDFEHHASLKAALDTHRLRRGNDVRGHAGRLLAKLLAVPFTMWIPGFSPPYGSGIATAVRRRWEIVETHRHAYGDCHGWLGDGSDCWASKGYLRVTIRLDRGDLLDVYNTHLDAGPDRRSTAARRAQLDELATAIERDSPNRAVIVGGDLNLSHLRPRDRQMLGEFRARLGLTDSGAGPQLPGWRERDVILFRSSETTQMTVLEAGEATEFVSDGRALSDHPALFATFAITSRP